MNGSYVAHCDNKKRNKNDLYETPYSVTQQLLDREKLIGKILEPACGNRAMVKVLKKNGYKDITYYDIETNFLKEKRKFDTIITNPPYSISLKFIKLAQKLSDNIYMLLPLNYLHGNKRYYDLYKDSNFKLKTIYIFVRYLDLKKPLRADGKCFAGMMIYAWFHWNKNYNGKPIIEWIDNNEFIVTKQNLKMESSLFKE